MITRINEWKKYKNLKSINEGGGAGIDFIVDDYINYSAQYKVNNGKIEFIDSSIDDIDKFDAIGYADGQSDVYADDMFNTIDNSSKLQFGDIEDIKISDIRYVNELDDVLHVFPNWDENDENDENMTIGEYMNKYNVQLNIIIDADIKFNTMHFGGWVRGTFDENDEIFNSSSNRNDVYHTSSIFINIDNEDGFDLKLYSKDYNVTNDILSKVGPAFTATTDFVNWFKYDYDEDFDDYDEDFDDYDE